MPRQHVSRTDRIRYYRDAADFWFGATQLQQARCLQAGKQSAESRVDLNFYVVAVHRLREVARMSHQRLGLEEAEQGLKEFDDRWPRIKNVRNLEEHILGPSGDAPTGIWYFDHAITDLQPGRVDYVVHIEHTQEAVSKLYKTLCELLDKDVP